MNKRDIERGSIVGAGRWGAACFEGPLPLWGLDELDRRESVAPENAEDFAHRVIFAICEAGVSASVALRTYGRCRCALALGATVRLSFRHPGKADAIDHIWRERASLYRAYRGAADPLAFLDTLPWIGPVTKRRLAVRLDILDAEAERPAGNRLKAVA